MAEKRMFSKQITDSDAFQDMPLSTQALYFHLGMQADDDGFINSPKRIQRVIGASDDDFKLLIAKSFIIPFESGVVVQKHWKINNYIRSDRYKETAYQEEKALLEVKPNGVYTLTKKNLGIPVGSIDKNRLDKNSTSSCFKKNDFNELLSVEDIQTLYEIYDDAGTLIDQCQADANKKKKVVDDAYRYIVGYATNKGWVEK